jgi:hypothetical protein
LFELVRGRAGRAAVRNAEAGSSGAVAVRIARREPASAEGDENLRKGARSNGAACARAIRNSARHRRRDRAGNVRFVFGA